MSDPEYWRQQYKFHRRMMWFWLILGTIFAVLTVVQLYWIFS